VWKNQVKFLTRFAGLLTSSKKPGLPVQSDEAFTLSYKRRINVNKFYKIYPFFEWKNQVQFLIRFGGLLTSSEKSGLPVQSDEQGSIYVSVQAPKHASTHGLLHQLRLWRWNRPLRGPRHELSFAIRYGTLVTAFIAMIFAISLSPIRLLVNPDEINRRADIALIRMGQDGPGKTLIDVALATHNIH